MALNKLNNNYIAPLEMKNVYIQDALFTGTKITTVDALMTGNVDIGVDSGDLRITDHYTAPAAVISLSNPDNYIQLALKNPAAGANSSADYIAYPDNGNDDFGYVDMGITSGNFSDPKFVITGPNDGYIFLSAPKPDNAVISATLLSGIVTIITENNHGYTNGDVVRIELLNGTSTGYYNVTIANVINETKFAFVLASTTLVAGNIPNIVNVYKTTGNGNLVFATDATGAANNIVFAAGGLATDTTQMIIYPNNKININITTASTSTTTGALVVSGGTGIAGALNVGGSIYSPAHSTPATATASTNSTALAISTGNATGTTSTSGAITIDTGTGTTAAGAITIGGTNAATLTLGRAALAATVPGGVSTTTINPNTGTTITVGNTATITGLNFATGNLATGTKTFTFGGSTTNDTAANTTFNFAPTQLGSGSTIAVNFGINQQSSSTVNFTVGAANNLGSANHNFTTFTMTGTTFVAAADFKYKGLKGLNTAVPTVASAATIAVTTDILQVSGTTQIATITAPSAFSNGGQITIIPTGAFTTTITGGNIAVATTAVVGKPLTMTYIGGAVLKWYPSY